MRIEQDILQILEKCTTDGTSLVITEQLDRNTYVRLNKCLEAAGGKWNKKAKAHIFTTDARSRIEDMILTGEVDVPKDEFSFFPTPVGIVEKMVEAAELQAHHYILEPSAGKGAILDGVLEVCREGKVKAIELMKENFDYLEGNYGDCNPEKADFLSVKPDPIYDRVLMNPPFSYTGHPQADIEHVLHAMKFLKSGGRLVAIMSASFTFRSNKLSTSFREMVDRYEMLPEGSFKASGTGVNTVMVVIDRE